MWGVGKYYLRTHIMWTDEKGLEKRAVVAYIYTSVCFGRQIPGEDVLGTLWKRIMSGVWL